MKKLFKVLVVDDDPAFLSLMGSYLSRLDCDAILIQDARQVVPLMTGDADIGLCFMDFVMPDMDGIELVRRIRKEVGSDCPIIAVSAFEKDISVDQCRGAGMADVLYKPLLFEDVKKIVTRYAKEDNS